MARKFKAIEIEELSLHITELMKMYNQENMSMMEFTVLLLKLIDRFEDGDLA